MSKLPYTIKCPICGEKYNIADAGNGFELTMGADVPDIYTQDFFCEKCNTEWSVEFKVKFILDKEEII